MATLSFGSFGDIVTLTQIAIQVYDAIDSSGRVVQELRASKKELDGFLTICGAVEQTINSGIAIHQDDLVIFRAVIDGCRECLTDFKTYLSRFNDKRQVMRIARRVRFVLSKKERISQFEGRMRGYASMLGLIQVKYCAQDVKAHITRSLEEPWDQRPMRFQDATGRRYPVPLEVCSIFDGFMNFLQYAFRTDARLSSAIQQQQFWMMTPACSDSRSLYIVQESDWASVAKPGTRLGMSFLAQHKNESSVHLGDQQSHQGERISTSSVLVDGTADTGDKESVALACTPKMSSNSPSPAIPVPDDGLNPGVAETFWGEVGNLKFDEPMPRWTTYDPHTMFKLL